MASLQSRLSDLITAIGTDYKALKGWIGDVTTLGTTTKTSAVAAINELHSEHGDLATLTTTAKSTFVAAINEVKAGESGAPPDASETVKGIAELATLAEVSTGTDTTRIVTPAGVKQETDAVKTAILNGAPAALDTLKELADALGDDANYATTVTNALAGKQPLDADLTAIAALASAADKVPYSTGAQAWSLATLTAAGRAIIDDADAAAQRTTLSVYSTTELGNPDTDLSALYTTAKT